MYVSHRTKVECIVAKGQSNVTLNLKYQGRILGDLSGNKPDLIALANNILSALKASPPCNAELRNDAGELVGHTND